MVPSQRELMIREVREGEEFLAWLGDLTHQYANTPATALEEKHLLLTDELGEWIGGLRFMLRGGVAQVLEVGVAPDERGQGHALRLLEGFEDSARDAGAHVIEFWTDRLSLEALLSALGWRRVLSRPDYIGGSVWHLLEKRLSPVTRNA
jgi:GNAT superfamily N-acetyltransferase